MPFYKNKYMAVDITYSFEFKVEHIISYHIIYPILSYHTMPYHIISYHIILHHIVLYHKGVVLFYMKSYGKVRLVFNKQKVHLPEWHDTAESQSRSQSGVKLAMKWNTSQNIKFGMKLSPMVWGIYMLDLRVRHSRLTKIFTFNKVSDTELWCFLWSAPK